MTLDANGKTFLHIAIAEVVYVVAALGLLAVYKGSKDVGFLIMAVLCGVSAVVSFWLSAWWPLVTSGILTGLLLFIGSGGWTESR